jgi:poly(3-hydroxybutyrate) depolymerase
MSVTMLYQAYLAQNDAMTPLRLMAEASSGFLNSWFGDNPLLRNAAAAFDMVSHSGIQHERPDFRIAETVVNGRTVAVAEEVVVATPFCSLLHFVKDSTVKQKKLLLVAPLSGHFATLLRGTVETMLPDHDLYVTDWVNARNVPLIHGRFDLDDFIDLVIDFVHRLGPDTHLVAVCQPAVPVLAAVALMAAEKDPLQPASMTLMGGPIDTRRNPTKPNLLATSHPLEWFERTVIETVPMRYPGAWRRVYPGFLQLAGFMTMNLDRHVAAHVNHYNHLVRGDGESAAAHRKFYDEYTSVMDLPADFYLQTISRVFQEHDLPLGSFVSRGRVVEPQAIERTALLCVEGENDDICAVGQTSAALDLCSGLPAGKKHHYLQPKVGHYGVFNGKRWRTEIYPRIREFIATSA